MANRIGRTATLLLVGTVLLGAVAERATAQCVGDCNGDGMVTINELIVGVNIVLGDLPVSACEAFANSEGQVTMAQLILGVNNALNGCPAVSPTPTETPTVTPTGTPAAGACTFLSGPTQSHLELNVQALANPVILPLVGSITVDCDVPDGSREGECTCAVGTIEPIRIPGVGTVCIAAAPVSCLSARVQCDGGEPLGVELRSDGDIGACDGNDACVAECAVACAGSGAVPSVSGCTGFCSLTNDVECSTDADCLPDNGACNGPDPVGAKADICQCNCINPAAGPPGVAGDLQCNLGVNLTVEMNPPCNGSDVIIDLGNSCITQTTARASTLITHANFGTGTVPATGTPATSAGAPIMCEPLTAGSLSGLKVRGVVNFFGSALGDIASLFAADCQ
jgi:hypothetical protein